MNTKDLLTGTILIGAGIYKTVGDYSNAPERHKTRTLIRNTAILGSAATTVLGAKYFFNRKLTNDFLNKKFDKFCSITSKQNRFPKIFSANVRAVFLNCTKDILTLICAATGGVFAGLITDKLLKNTKFDNIKEINIPSVHFERPFRKIIKNPVITTITNDKSKMVFLNAAKFFNAAGFIQNPLDVPNTIIHSYDMAKKDTNLYKIAEKTSIGILANTFIPTLFLSIADNFVANKKLLLKIPVLAASFFAGDILGNKVSKKLEKN